MDTPAPLNRQEIAGHLRTQRIGRRLLVMEEVSSTNDVIWEYAAEPDADGLCVFAEKQTAGRGRRGRRWYDVPAESLLFSILLRSGRIGADLLGLASAVAVAECLAGLSIPSLQIKWPNDVLIASKKVCGILCESKTVRSQPWFAVGIGINVHQKREFFERVHLADSAASLAAETDQPLDRNVLAALLLNSLDDWFRASRDGGQKIADTWKRYNRQIGNPIRILENRQTFVGTCLDIDPIRGLVVQLHDGPIRFFHAADCTIIPCEKVF
jgi:BirA family biotin operon repressor/biotin-[acetyl-CoA-carboxylase] ligase